MRNIRQNLFFALVYNAIGVVPLTAGALYPLWGIRLSPLIAAAMALSSLSVATNASRLRHWRTSPLPARHGTARRAPGGARSRPNPDPHPDRSTRTSPPARAHRR